MKKITVCKGCKNVMQATDEKGNPACVICYGVDKNNSIPEEVEIPKYVSCSCGSKAIWNNKKQKWILELTRKGGWNATYDGNREVADIPFLNTKDKKFYCGCMGWE